MIPPKQPAEHARKLKILVVDDEKALQKAMTRILTGVGHEVLSAGSGEDALRLWDEAHGSIDLVVTDVLMPNGIDGHELAEAIWSRGATTPFIFSSGRRDESLDELAPALRARVSFLPKPFAPPDLRAAVERMVSRPEACE